MTVVELVMMCTFAYFGAHAGARSAIRQLRCQAPPAPPAGRSVGLR